MEKVGNLNVEQTEDIITPSAGVIGRIRHREVKGLVIDSESEVTDGCKFVEPSGKGKVRVDLVPAAIFGYAILVGARAVRICLIAPATPTATATSATRPPSSTAGATTRAWVTNHSVGCWIDESK